VVAFDRDAPASGAPTGVTPVVADLADADAVREAVTGCDSVIHVAKSGGPSHTDVFAVNTSATYNVLAAAADEGIRHAAIASSVCAYGTVFARRPFSFHYAPVDEDHPLLPQDAYSLSKVVDETTARAYVDGYGMSVVALRFHWLAEPAEVRTAADRLAALPEPAMSRDLWCYTELDDAARACELALRVDDGFHALNICAADNLSQVPTEELIARFHPDTEIRSPIEGTASAWSTERARKVLGFVPEYSWRTAR
jgi:nucleoside-diphosphate-sugar epimerase